MTTSRVFFITFLSSLILGLVFVSTNVNDSARAQMYGAPYQEEHMPKTPKERREEASAERARRKIRATWDDRTMSQTVSRLQELSVKSNGDCNGACISTYRCAVDGLANEIPYEQYDYYFVHPLRSEDMNARERELNEQYQATWKRILSGCQQQVELGLNRTGTIAGLELQMEAMDAIRPDHISWLEFYRSDNAISQYDPNRVVEKTDASHAVVKNVWLRQFSTNLNGNYALAQNQYDCTNKDVQMLSYRVYNVEGKEIFGDYMPSKKIPMDLHNKKSEDYALYLRLCPSTIVSEKRK